MKKTFIGFIILLSSVLANAQGIYQFWGMAPAGGSDNLGTIFNTDVTASNFQGKHHFINRTPGGSPQYTEPVAYNGKFYGMALFSPSNTSGIIFQWDPATNIYTKKVDFNGVDGRHPYGSLVLYDGKFYGMTAEGGNTDEGVIFEWDPATNIYTKKIDFSDADGRNPYGNLTLHNGKFYGMTHAGGINNAGVVFEWDPATNTYTKKVDLGPDEGANPFGSLLLDNDKFYGMTNKGGMFEYGVIFEWDPATNQYNKQVDFDGDNGKNPFGSLKKRNGKYYGMTQAGGFFDDGVIFEWDPSGNLCTKKIELNNLVSGKHPYGSLSQFDGKFYGMTSMGGDNGLGVIFEWDPTNNSYTKKIDFNGPNGRSPLSSLTLSGGKFYGFSTQGGGSIAISGYPGDGIIFSWDPSTNHYTKKIDFNDTDGAYPYGTLTQTGGKLYGLTQNGGSNNAGVIFEWNPATDQYSKKMDFNGTDGSLPYGNLVANAGKLYGKTLNGGSNDAGVFFEWNPATNQYTKKIDLANSNGSFPSGNLVVKDAKIYGMTMNGGANNKGVIFEWDPASNIYTKKFDFDGTNGSFPVGSLALKDGKLYGMTQWGGTDDVGVIFEWDPATNIYTKKIDLNITDGANPSGSLTLSGNKFYAVTDFGGSTGVGVIFEWDPANNTYTKKIDFDGSNGSFPNGSLTLSGSKLYGMTNAGGSFNQGVIFEWDPASNEYKTKKDFNGTEGSNPTFNTDLNVVSASVANGTPGSCFNLPPVLIDNSNNNVWVPIIDNGGNAVAEIKANGNNLGIINTSMFVNNGTVREDGNHKLYLDRNITITPTTAPSSTVDIRLYIKGSELEQLKNALNSEGQPAGVSSINEIGIFKNDDDCSSAVQNIANPISTGNIDWQTDYVLSTSINSFSTFYFANFTQGGPLPITQLDFNGRLSNRNAVLNWKTTDETNTLSFELERSKDGVNYTKIASVAATNLPGVHQYNYTDDNVILFGVPVVYYRIKQKEIGGRFAYSQIVPITISKVSFVILYPNPAFDKANLIMSVNKAEQVQARVIDNMGRIVMQQQWKLSVGSNSLTLDVNNLARGIYYLELKGETINEHKQFSKQ